MKEKLRQLFTTIAVMSFAAFAWQTAMAQTSASTQVVTGSAGTDRIRFVTGAGVVRTKVEIISNSGESVFEGNVKGSVFDWTLQGGDGQRVADGTYVCVVTVKSLSGKISQRIGSVSLQAGKAELQRKTELTEAQQASIGPIEENALIAVLDKTDVPSATVVSHDGVDGQLTSTTGDLTFRTGDIFSGTENERMRITADGRVGIGTTKPEAELDVAGTIRAQKGLTFLSGSTLTVDEKGGMRVTRADGTVRNAMDAAGTGTQNKLAKWAETGGAGTLGDSIITDLNGNVGVNTATPGTINGITFSTVPLHLFRSANSAYMAVEATGAGAFAGLLLNRSSANANQRMWVVDNQPDTTQSSSVLAFSSYSDNGVPTARMSITQAGFVGIGTKTPAMKLDVVGDINTSTKYFLGGSQFLSATVNGTTILGLGTGATNVGDQNTFVGNTAGAATTFSGTENAFYAYRSGLINTSGFGNSFFGSRSGNSNVTGHKNAFFGNYAGAASTGNDNSIFGGDAGLSMTSGNGNTLIGNGTGPSMTTGTNNILLGYKADASTGLSNATAIGQFSLVTQNNSLVLGSISGVGGAFVNTNVGIGTTKPQAKLEIKGGNIVLNGNGNGIVLVSPDGATCRLLQIANVTGDVTVTATTCPVP